MSSWNCPKCNFNNSEYWTECNSCWTKPIKPELSILHEQEDRIKTLNLLKSHLYEIELINPNSEYISWFEDKVRRQEDVVKKHQREYNLKLLIADENSL